MRGRRLTEGQEIAIAVLDRKLASPIVVHFWSSFDRDLPVKVGVESHHVINVDPQLPGQTGIGIPILRVSAKCQMDVAVVEDAVSGVACRPF